MGAADLVQAAKNCPAIVADGNQRIIAANDAAAQLLGCSRDALIGQRCSRVLCGRDGFGNEFRHDDCMASSLADGGEPICIDRIELRTSAGTYVPVGLTTLFTEGEEPGSVWAFHFFSAAPPQPSRSTAERGEHTPEVGRAFEAVGRKGGLSCLDLHVLELLDHGQDLPAIAEGMHLTVGTIRRRHAYILRKLRAATTSEALDIVRRQGLLRPGGHGASAAAQT